MASICYDKVRRSEIYIESYAEARVRDIYFTKLKLKENDTYKIDEKIKIKFEPSYPEVVANKFYLDRILSNVEGHIAFRERKWNEFNLRSNKQPEQEVLIKKQWKQLYKYFMIKVYLIIIKMHKKKIGFLLIEVNERRRPSLGPTNDVFEWFYSKIV